MIEHYIRQIILDGITSGNIHNVTSDNVMTAAVGTHEWTGENRVWVLAGETSTLSDMLSDSGESAVYETEITVSCMASDYINADSLRNEITSYLESHLPTNHNTINDSADMVIFDWVPERIDAAPRFDNGSFHDEYSSLKTYKILHTF